MSNVKSLFANKAATETKSEKQVNRLYINLGFTVDINGTATFVELPLAITADNIGKAIESVNKRINENTPAEMQEILMGKIAIAEAVQSLFETMDDGQEVKAQDIDPDDENFGFLSGLEVRFFRAKEKSAPEGAENARKSIVSKFRK